MIRIAKDGEREMKKSVRIGFHSSINEENKIFWQQVLCDEFDVQFVEKDYDYYIATETIYWSHARMQEFLSCEDDAIRIFWCGEAIFPDLNLFDYAIWHCMGYFVEDRIIYDPLIRTEIGCMLNEIEEIDRTKNIDSPESLKNILDNKTNFCNFIYANSKSHPMRDNLFKQISKYKRVDSLGRHLKNVEIVDSRDDEDWLKKSIELKKKYKFTIAAENACFPGYTSEKIMTSMMANSIPIYWGNQYIDKEFNEKSFINANHYQNIDDLIARIIELDNDDEQYIEMLRQPWRTEKQILDCRNAVDKFVPSLKQIFRQDKNVAYRRPKGCWPDYIYSKFMYFDKNKVF